MRGWKLKRFLFCSESIVWNLFFGVLCRAGAGFSVRMDYISFRFSVLLRCCCCCCYYSIGFGVSSNVSYWNKYSTSFYIHSMTTQQQHYSSFSIVSICMNTKCCAVPYIRDQFGRPSTHEGKKKKKTKVNPLVHTCIIRIVCVCYWCCLPSSTVCVGRHSFVWSPQRSRSRPPSGLYSYSMWLFDFFDDFCLCRLICCVYVPYL